MRGRNNRQGQQSFFADETAVVMAAAHELKSPLTLITYIAQILADKTLGLSDVERADYLRRLQVVSERALRLTQQLAVSYRIREDQVGFVFNLEPINVNMVCESALHELAPYAREYDQMVCFKAARRAQTVIANREILHDVLTNLIENAIRHNAPKTEVTMMARTRDGKVRLNVHDNGELISAREVLRLRQTLGRSPQPLTGHAGTSGLGLYIVSQLASAMGGSLGIGRAKRGTTFFVDLYKSQQMNLW